MSARATALSLVALLAAILARAALTPYLHDDLPFLTVIAAVAVSALYAGAGTAILVALAGFVVGYWLFIGHGAWTGLAWPAPAAVAIYVAVSAVIIWLGTSSRHARRGAAERARQLEQLGLQHSREAAERAAAERALEESAAQFRRLTDAMPDIAYLCDANGRVTYVNRRWTEYTGVGLGTREQLRGPIHPADQQSLDTAWRKAKMARTPFRVELRLRSERDGRYRWFDARGVPIINDDGAIAGWIGTTVDIDDVRAAREAAQKSAERLRLTVEGTDAGLWDQDLMNGEIALSIRAAAIVGLDAGTRLSGAFLRTLVHPDDRTRVRQIFARASTGADPRFQLECRIRTPVAGERWVMIRGAAYTDGEARPQRLSGLVLDITERKHLEEELRAADRRKDEFLAVLAHELRNPLAPIRYATRLLAHGTPAAMADDARRMIDRQLAQMARLLDDLLDVSRIGRGRLELRKEILDLRSVIESTLALAQPLIESVGHRLQLSLPDTPLPVEGDATRLGQVIDNLLSNAAKYTESGGTISVSAEWRGTQVQVRVRDTGIGMSAEALTKIFTLFVRAEDDGIGKREGLGIGLALSRQLVEMHGGRLDASSAGLGKGSEFTVTLPKSAERPSVTRIPESAPNVVPLPRRCTTLVVDDNVDAALSLSRLLELSGYQVHVAHDGMTALQMAEVLRPDIVILDLGMPRMSGIEAARSIRRQTWGSSIHLIAVTGWGQQADRDRTRAAGFDEHLVKPIDPDHLQAVLARVRPSHDAPQDRSGLR